MLGILITKSFLVLSRFFFLIFSFISICMRVTASIVIIIVTPWEFFTTALADNLSLESAWQQVSSSLQDSSQYSGRSQWCSSFECFDLSSYFQVLQSFYQSYGDCTKSTNYNWYNHHFYYPRFLGFFFNSLARLRYLSLFSLSFNFTLWSPGTAKSIILQVPPFFVDYHTIWSSCRYQVICLYVKIPEKLVGLIFLDKCWVVHIPFVRMVKFQFLAQFTEDPLAHLVVSGLILFLC